jgi:ABC-2 type transport system permease protein
MKVNRIYGVILRHVYLFTHSLDKWVDVFYWPLIDLLLWGITGLFINSLQPGFSQYVVMIVSGLIFWQVVWRGQIEITVDVLEEIWNKNLINLFVTPLKFSEWMSSFIILGIVKLIASFSFVSVFAYLLYKINILTFGIYMVPFIALLIMSGWWIGILVGSLILRFGSRIQALAWSIAWVLSPFSAIFYPVSILPQWAQKVAWFFPTSHIFEGMRSVISTGHVDSSQFVVSLILNIIYLAVSIFILRLSFQKVLDKGLIKVY